MGTHVKCHLLIFGLFIFLPQARSEEFVNLATQNEAAPTPAEPTVYEGDYVENLDKAIDELNRNITLNN